MSVEFKMRGKNGEKAHTIWTIEIQSNLTWTKDLIEVLSEGFKKRGLALELKEITRRAE